MCVCPQGQGANTRAVLLASAMLPKRRSSAHDLDLQREITTLQLKLLRVNSALAITRRAMPKDWNTCCNHARTGSTN
jgi:hypothetical protein